MHTIHIYKVKNNHVFLYTYLHSSIYLIAYIRIATHTHAYLSHGDAILSIDNLGGKRRVMGPIREREDSVIV